MNIIVDTGPLVAFLNKRDVYHQWALQRFSELEPPFLTCEPVLSEVCFLLRNFSDASSKVFGMLDRDLIQIAFSLQRERDAVHDLMQKYRDLPMSLADACLVRMGEQFSGSTVCTLDSDFKIYRKEQRKVIPVLMPAVLRHHSK